jgi:hypothetical protein
MAKAKPDLDRAAAYVREHGDALARGRLEALLGGAADGEAAQLVAAGQNEDGGWPADWSNGVSSLDATCYRLDHAVDLGDAVAGPVGRALDFLAARRGDDGFWEEDASLAEAAPPWAKPGDDAAALYVTGSCAYWLARNGRPEADRAAGALSVWIQDDGTVPTYLPGAWLVAGALALVGRQLHAQFVLQPLEPRVGELDDAGLAWLASSLGAAGLGDEPVVAAARKRLAELQAKDGGWANDPGTTVTALRALRGAT